MSVFWHRIRACVYDVTVYECVTVPLQSLIMRQKYIMFGSNWRWYSNVQSRPSETELEIEIE